MTTTVPATIPQLFVQIRSGWSQPWETIANLEVDKIDWAVSSISTATLRWAYGSIDEGDGVYAECEPLDVILGTFCRICRPPVIEDGEFDPVAVWHGVITSNPDSIGGSDVTSPTGEQIFTARSLEFLLARTAVDCSVVLADSEARKIDETLPFNLASCEGNPIYGNRSAAKYTNPDNGLSSYIFAGGTSGSQVWTGQDAIEYLLAWFAPLKMTATGQVANLAQIKQVFPPPQTVWGGISAIVDRRRGHHCLVDVNSTTGGVILRVGSCFGEKVAVGGVEITPAPIQISLDADYEDVTDVIVREDAEHQYDRIIVSGGRVILCGTLRFSTGTLKTGWSSSAESAYKSADDLGRTAETLANVYRTFLADTDNLPAGPSITDDGVIDADESPAQFYHGKSLLRHLPTEKNDDDDGGPVEFRQPLILIQGVYKGSQIYAPITKPLHRNAPSGGMGFVMLDGEMGFRLTGKYAHYLANGHFSGATASRFPEVFNYGSLIATVAWPSSEAFQIITEIDNGIVDFQRTLVIRVPDAECWYMLANTVTDINSSGGLVTQGPTTLRHDRDKLAAVASLAAAWYEKPRRAVTVNYSTLLFGFLPGDFVSDVTGGNLMGAKVNTAISRIIWNAGKGTTTIQTDFAELDFVAVAGVSGHGSTGLTPSHMSPRRRDKDGNLAVAPGDAPGELSETPFLVMVTMDGGLAGGEATECTYTYTVKALDDSTILPKDDAGAQATAMTPETPRLHYTEYWYAGETRTAPAAATSRYGMAAYDSDGDLHLLACFGEIGKDDACE